MKKVICCRYIEFLPRISSCSGSIPVLNDWLCCKGAKISTTTNITEENDNKPTNNKIDSANKSNYLGTEINAEATYQLLDGFSVSTRVAYAMLGDCLSIN